MPAKAFVIFFRYKFLLLAPFLVTLPLAIAYVALSADTNYQATGKVRVERPTFLASDATAGWNGYISLAGNQANFVRQRLKTEEFTQRVAATASEGYSRPITSAEVRAGAWAAELGPNLLEIGYTGGDPEAARRISQAIIDEYAIVEREQTTADAQRAKELRTAALANLQTKADNASVARAAYLAAHPELGRSQTVADQDVQFQQLNKALRDANDAVSTAESELTEADQFAKATLEGQQRTFNPIADDAPQTPTAPLGRKKSDLVAPPIMAMLASMALAATVYGFLFRTDRSLRSREDIVSMLPNVTFLGTVPDVPAPRTSRMWPRSLSRVTATTGDDVEDALRRV